MSLPLTIEWKIITEDKEKRIDSSDNTFEIMFSGYKLFPMDTPIDIMRHKESEQIGTAVITHISFENNATLCKYQLVSLYSVN
ncbi:DUF2584 family protein [Salirhabdus sp. Marseille-P4669]|uniref:DUF2584 family protein n=1 Tax=Salirhabdus sp. Marseille-P4669 TaxID=2042310 RepID=UPI000C7C3C63|nr:DUF2584 family protein [Salirhabdus sp. Marseille-P4669]